MSSSLFNAKNYYRLFNANYPNSTVSAGVYYAAGAPINMTQSETYSSTENWQIFAQSGIYFIRNYQAGASLQLGLTADDLSVPRLLASSGGLGQQWTVASRTDGTFRITNGLVANSSSLGVVKGITVPAMDTSDADGHWDISINVSAGTITDQAMLASVSNVVPAPKTSSTSSSVIGSSTSTIAGSTSSTSVSSSNSSATPSSNAITNSASTSAISGGAIAGIVIGVFALVAVLTALVFFLMRRQKQKSSVIGQPRSELDGTGKLVSYENEKRLTLIQPPVEMDAEQRPVGTETGHK